MSVDKKALEDWGRDARAMTDEVSDFHDTIKKASAKLDINNTLLRVVKRIGYVVLVLLTLTFFLAATNRMIFNEVRKVVVTIEDCTIPSTKTEQRKCFERSQKATADALRQIAEENQRQHDELEKQLNP